MSKEKFGSIEGGGENNKAETLKALNNFLNEYAGHAMDEESKWRVCGKDKEGMMLLFQIKHCEEEEFVAKKIVQLINQLGGNARVEEREE